MEEYHVKMLNYHSDFVQERTWMKFYYSCLTLDGGIVKVKKITFNF